MTDAVEVHPSGTAGTKRLIRGKSQVGLVVKGSDKRWKVYDADRRLVTHDSFAKTAEACEAFVRLEHAERLNDTLPPPIKMESAGFPGVKRLVRGEAVVAMLLQLTNDRWTLCDTNEVRITPYTYGTPASALKAFVDHEAQAKGA